MRKLLIATTNAGKIREFRTLLSPFGLECFSLVDIGLNLMKVEETGDTFAANALIKADAYSKTSKLPTLADDSGLVVDALDGAPGVYSARYAPTEEECNTKLLNALEGVSPELRTARYVAVLALVTSDGVTITAEGTVEGRIGFTRRGTNGFGYDPLFLVDDHRTMAELSDEEKNMISHRGRAFAKLAPLITYLFPNPA